MLIDVRKAKAKEKRKKTTESARVSARVADETEAEDNIHIDPALLLSEFPSPDQTMPPPDHVDLGSASAGPMSTALPPALSSSVHLLPGPASGIMPVIPPALPVDWAAAKLGNPGVGYAYVPIEDIRVPEPVVIEDGGRGKRTRKPTSRAAGWLQGE